MTIKVFHVTHDQMVVCVSAVNAEHTNSILELVDYKCKIRKLIKSWKNWWCRAHWSDSVSLAFSSWLIFRNLVIDFRISNRRKFTEKLNEKHDAGFTPCPWSPPVSHCDFFSLNFPIDLSEFYWRVIGSWLAVNCARPLFATLHRLRRFRYWMEIHISY